MDMDKNDEVFIINDITMGIRPSDIQVLDDNFLLEDSYMRSTACFVYRSKHANNKVVLNFPFQITDISEDIAGTNNTQNCIKLISQLNDYPFCFIQSKRLETYIAPTVIASCGYLMFAVDEIAIITRAETSNILFLEVTLMYCNHYPLVKDFKFRSNSKVAPKYRSDREDSSTDAKATEVYGSIVEQEAIFAPSLDQSEVWQDYFSTVLDDTYNRLIKKGYIADRSLKPGTHNILNTRLLAPFVQQASNNMSAGDLSWVDGESQVITVSDLFNYDDQTFEKMISGMVNDEFNGQDFTQQIEHPSGKAADKDKIKPPVSKEEKAKLPPKRIYDVNLGRYIDVSNSHEDYLTDPLNNDGITNSVIKEASNGSYAAQKNLQDGQHQLNPDNPHNADGSLAVKKYGDSAENTAFGLGGARQNLFIQWTGKQLNESMGVAINGVEVRRKNKLATHQIGSFKHPVIQHMGRYSTQITMNLSIDSSLAYGPDQNINTAGPSVIIKQMINMLEYNQNMYPQALAYNFMKLESIATTLLDAEGCIPSQSQLIASATNQGVEGMIYTFAEGDISQFLQNGLVTESGKRSSTKEDHLYNTAAIQWLTEFKNYLNSQSKTDQPYNINNTPSLIPTTKLGVASTLINPIGSIAGVLAGKGFNAIENKLRDAPVISKLTPEQQATNIQDMNRRLDIYRTYLQSGDSIASEFTATNTVHIAQALSLALDTTQVGSSNYNGLQTKDDLTQETTGNNLPVYWVDPNELTNHQVVDTPGVPANSKAYRFHTTPLNTTKKTYNEINIAACDLLIGLLSDRDRLQQGGTLAGKGLQFTPNPNSTPGLAKALGMIKGQANTGDQIATKIASITDGSASILLEQNVSKFYGQGMPDYNLQRLRNKEGKNANKPYDEKTDFVVQKLDPFFFIEEIKHLNGNEIKNNYDVLSGKMGVNASMSNQIMDLANGDHNDEGMINMASDPSQLGAIPPAGPTIEQQEQPDGSYKQIQRPSGPSDGRLFQNVKITPIVDTDTEPRKSPTDSTPLDEGRTILNNKPIIRVNPADVKADVNSAIIKAWTESKHNGDKEFLSYMFAACMIESSGGMNTHAKGSSFYGIFQFGAPAIQDVNNAGHNFWLSQIANDPYASAQAFIIYFDLLKTQLAAKNINQSHMTYPVMYIAHNQGAGGANNILRAAAGTQSLTSTVRDHIIAQHSSSISGNTDQALAISYIQYFSGKLGADSGIVNIPSTTPAGTTKPVVPNNPVQPSQQTLVAQQNSYQGTINYLQQQNNALTPVSTTIVNGKQVPVYSAADQATINANNSLIASNKTAMANVITQISANNTAGITVPPDYSQIVQSDPTTQAGSQVIPITSFSPNQQTVTVVKVLDGDTVDVRLNDPPHTLIRIRNYGIDAPEVDHIYGTSSDSGAEPFGYLAGQAMSQLVMPNGVGQTMKMINYGVDSSGERTVGQLILEDGTDVQLALLKTGYVGPAQGFSIPSNYTDANNYAKTNKLGQYGLQDGARKNPRSTDPIKAIDPTAKIANQQFTADDRTAAESKQKVNLNTWRPLKDQTTPVSKGGEYTYGQRRIDSETGQAMDKPHYGIDFGAPIGTDIIAAADGVVIKAGWDSKHSNSKKTHDGGIIVAIDHGNGFQSWYMHMSSVAVQMGQKVKYQQVIGKVGNTGIGSGTHVHYEVRYKGSAVNPWGTKPLPEYTTSGMLASETNTPPATLAHAVNPSDDLEQAPENSVYNEEHLATLLIANLEKHGMNTGLSTAVPVVKAWITIGQDEADFFLGTNNSHTQYYELRGIKNVHMACNNDDNPVDILTMEVANPSFCNTDSYGVSGKMETISIQDIGTDKEYAFINDRIKVKPGMKLHVRAGYSNDPNELEIIFNGSVVDVDNSDIQNLSLMCEGFGKELLGEIFGPAQAIKFGDTGSATTVSIFASALMSQQIFHFGKVYSRAIALQNQLGDDSDPESKTGYGARNLSHVGLSWNSGYFIGGFTQKNLRSKVFMNVFATAIENSDGNQYDRDWLNFFSFNHDMSTEFMVYQMTAWEIMKQMEYRHPGTICKPMMYEGRMSLFFGIKEQMYFAKDANIAVMALAADPNSTPEQKSVYDRKTRMKPAVNFHAISSYSNLISNGISINMDYSTVTNVNWYSSASQYEDRYKWNTFKMQIDDDLFPWDLREKDLTLSGCESRYQAFVYGTEDLRKECEKMYGGKIFILGNASMKAGDYAYIDDHERRMLGVIKVRECYHHIDENGGFVTEIVPGQYVEAANFMHSTLWSQMALSIKAATSKVKLDSAGAYKGTDFATVTDYLFVIQQWEIANNTKGTILNPDNALIEATYFGFAGLTAILANSLVTNTVTTKLGLTTGLASRIPGLRTAEFTAYLLEDLIRTVANGTFNNTVNELEATIRATAGDKVADSTLIKNAKWASQNKKFLFDYYVKDNKFVKKIIASEAIQKVVSDWNAGAEERAINKAARAGKNSGLLASVGKGVWTGSKFFTRFGLKASLTMFKTGLSFLFTSVRALALSNPLGILLDAVFEFAMAWAYAKVEETNLTRQPLMFFPLIQHGKPYIGGMSGAVRNSYWDSLGLELTRTWHEINKSSAILLANRKADGTADSSTVNTVLKLLAGDKANPRANVVALYANDNDGNQQVKLPDGTIGSLEDLEMYKKNHGITE